MENMNIFQTALRGVLLSLIFIVLYHCLVTSLAVVDIEVTTDNRTTFKIYYSDSTRSWSESRMAEVLIKPGQTHYSMRLANLNNISEIRIDTSEKKAYVQVASLAISQPGFSSILINSPEQFRNLEVGGGVADFSYSQNGFSVKPSSHDPNLFYQLPPLQSENIAIGQLIRLLVLVLLAFMIVLVSGTMFTDSRFVVYSGLVVLTLIVVMASLSNYNQHPDEAVHISAANYYVDHNLPPQIGDPTVAQTYSIYGFSRLNSGEISYFFAGKFAKLFKPLHVSDYLVFRYFNVTLFSFLLLFAVYQKPFRILFIPLLLSPQIWYTFSYFNSEGFGMVVILLIAYQMVVPDSAWNRLLSVDGPRCTWWELLCIIILLGVLLLLKLNFYFFGVYLFLYFLWRLLYKKTVCNIANLTRVCLVALAGISVFVGVTAFDSSIHDFKKNEKILEASEIYANEMYKPSTPLEKKYAYLQMKDRGVTLKKIFEKHLWGEKIFRSSFGEYGHTTVAASYGYYDFIRNLAVIGLLVISFFTIKNGGWEGLALLVITVGCAGLLWAAALYGAWAVDFQAQGRYLLPIVGMLSMFAYDMRERLANLPCVFVLSSMFMVALYSFIFVALAGITKVSFAIG